MNYAKEGSYKLVEVTHQPTDPLSRTLDKNKYFYNRTNIREEITLGEFLSKMKITHRWTVRLAKVARNLPRWPETYTIHLINFEPIAKKYEYLLEPVREFPKSSIPNVYILTNSGISVFYKNQNDIINALSLTDKNTLWNTIKQVPDVNIGDKITFQQQICKNRSYMRSIRSVNGETGVMVDKKFVKLQDLKDVKHVVRSR